MTKQLQVVPPLVPPGTSLHDVAARAADEPGTEACDPVPPVSVPVAPPGDAVIATEMDDSEGLVHLEVVSSALVRELPQRKEAVEAPRFFNTDSTDLTPTEEDGVSTQPTPVAQDTDAVRANAAEGGSNGAPGSTSVWHFAPSNGKKVGIREAPYLTAKQTGQVLKPGDTFSVDDVVAGDDGIRYLRLADGSGWVFDTKPGAGRICFQAHEVPEKVSYDQERTLWRCDPCNGKRVGIRAGPSFDSKQTGYVLVPGETFRVDGTYRSPDGVRFLKLSDDRGWAFDRKSGVGDMCLEGVNVRRVSKRSREPLSSTPALLETTQWRCEPCNGKKLGIRDGPSFDAKQTGLVLKPGEVFSVSDTCVSDGGVRFLKLADGRGWVFDSKPGVGAMCFEGVPDGQLKRLVDNRLGEAPPAAVGLADDDAPPELHDATVWTCAPCNGRRVGIRSTPSLDGRQSGHLLNAGEVFSVSETREGPDGVLLLKLADGRGWTFNHKPNVGAMCVKVEEPDEDPVRLREEMVVDTGAKELIASGRRVQDATLRAEGMESFTLGEEVVINCSARDLIATPLVSPRDGGVSPKCSPRVPYAVPSPRDKRHPGDPEGHLKFKAFNGDRPGFGHLEPIVDAV